MFEDGSSKMAIFTFLLWAQFTGNFEEIDVNVAGRRSIRR
jgi:hypothetical protein